MLGSPAFPTLQTLTLFAAVADKRDGCLNALYQTACLQLMQCILILPLTYQGFFGCVAAAQHIHAVQSVVASLHGALQIVHVFSLFIGHVVEIFAHAACHAAVQRTDVEGVDA